MTIKTALRKLIYKMTGKTATSSTAGALIDELAEDYVDPTPDLSDYYTKEETDEAIAAIDPADILIHVPCLEVSYYPGASFYALDIRTQEQEIKGGMDEITAEDLHTQIEEMIYNGTTKQRKTAAALKAMFCYTPALIPGGDPVWQDDSVLLAFVQIEVDSGYGVDGYSEVMKAVAETLSENNQFAAIRRGIPNVADTCTKAEATDIAQTEVAAHTPLLVVAEYDSDTDSYVTQYTIAQIYNAVVNGNGVNFRASRDGECYGGVFAVANIQPNDEKLIDVWMPLLFSANAILEATGADGDIAAFKLV